MTKTFRPMLASPVEVNQVQLPCIASPKLDGIRCVIHEGVAKSRKLELIPNDFVRGVLSDPKYVNMDGEIVTFTDGALDDFNTIQSKVMRKDGMPKFRFIVFDDFSDRLGPYTRRRISLRKRVDPLDHYVSVIEDIFLNTLNDFTFMEEEYVREGYEGIMIRNPDAPYKFGRSTVKEGALLKYKRFEDTEAVVIGFVEKMTNLNKAQKDALGLTKRSSKKANKVGAGVLGALVCQTPKGVEFEIGTGFDLATRKRIWDNQDRYLGATVNYQYQEFTPAGKPRFPSFRGFRTDL